MSDRSRLPIYIFVTFCTSFSPLYASASIEMFKDKQNRTIALQQITNPHVVALAAPIFTKALLKAYMFHSDEELCIPPMANRAKLLDTFFAHEELIPFCQEKFWAIGAFDQDTLIGYISLEASKPQKEIHIRQLVVDPYYWRNNIGTRLVFSPLKLFPEATSLGLVIHEGNDGARNFCQKLGFAEGQKYVYSHAKLMNLKNTIVYKKFIDSKIQYIQSRL